MIASVSAGLTDFWAYLAGFCVILVIVLISAALGGTWKIWHLADGADGRLSISKAQWMAWTICVAFGYVATYVALAVNGHQSPMPGLPANVLLVMGFSATTMATAKGLTTFFTAQGRVVKAGPPPARTGTAAAPTVAAPPPVGAAVQAPAAPGVSGPAASASPTGYWADLLVDDANQSDLSKMQLLVWTLIAIAVFVANVVGGINTVVKGGSISTLPDIDGAFMVLMGLSQGGYLGKKLVTSNRLQLIALTPPAVNLSKGGSPSVNVIGSGFGAALGSGLGTSGQPEDPTSMLLVNGLQVAATSWSDTKIVFVVDRSSIASLSGTWTSPQVLTITVTVAGQYPQDPQTLQQQTLVLTVI
jgi:hypothetical protein